MTLNYLINKPVEEVYQCLSDMTLFTEVHPVIYKIDRLNENNYQFYEQLKFFPARFNYKVTIEKLEPNSYVQMYSEVQKGVELNLSFVLKTTNNKTAIEETILIKAPFIIKQIFRGIIKRAHRNLFENIALRNTISLPVS